MSPELEGKKLDVELKGYSIKYFENQWYGALC